MRCIGGPLYWKDELCWNAKRCLREFYTLFVELLIAATVVRLIVAAIILSQNLDLMNVFGIGTLIVLLSSSSIQSMHSLLAWRKILPFFEEYAIINSIQLSDCRLICLLKYTPTLMLVGMLVMVCAGVTVHAISDEFHIFHSIVSYPWTPPFAISMIVYTLTALILTPATLQSLSLLVILATSSYLIVKETSNIQQNIEESLNDISVLMANMESWRQKYLKLYHLTNKMDDIGLFHNGIYVLQSVVRK